MIHGLWTVPVEVVVLCNWFVFSSAERGPYNAARVTDSRETGARRPLVYLTAKYQGNRRLTALPPTLAAKTNSFREECQLLS